MKFIEEVVVERFLPTYRSMLAEALTEEGLNQSEVAEVLGITQSAISKYAAGQIDRDPRVEEHGSVGELVDRCAKGLADGSMSPVQALVETEVLIRELEHGDLLAELHREAVPALADEPIAGEIHDPGGRLRERAQILDSLRISLQRLERLGGFAAVIPQVGSNLVFAREEATTIDEVAGVPGRIVEIKGRATVPAEPEFGVSEHVATVVLAAMRAGSEARAALNLAFEQDLMYRLEAAGYRTAQIKPAHDLLDEVERVVRSSQSLDVIYHEDGPGIEANVYLLGSDPEAVVALVEEALE